MDSSSVNVSVLSRKQHLCREIGKLHPYPSRDALIVPPGCYSVCFASRYFRVNYKTLFWIKRQRKFYVTACIKLCCNRFLCLFCTKLQGNHSLRLRVCLFLELHNSLFYNCYSMSMFFFLNLPQITSLASICKNII